MSNNDIFIKGLAYPPGVTSEQRDQYPLYVRVEKMKEFAASAVGKPLNLNHPNKGDPSNVNQIGFIERAEVDPETGGVRIHAPLNTKTIAGWDAYQKIKNGDFSQLSIGNTANLVLNKEDVRYEAVDHVVDEVSCVEQGDNEEGRGFKTAITHLSEPSASHQMKRNYVDSLMLGASLRTSDLFLGGL